VFVAVSADFDDRIAMGAAETLIETIESELKAADSRITSIYIRPEKQIDAVAYPKPERRAQGG
jgi:hypothetical protein